MANSALFVSVQVHTARVLRTLGPFWCAPCPRRLPRGHELLHRDSAQIANCFNYVAGKMPQHVACCVLNCWRTRRNFSTAVRLFHAAVGGVLGAARVLAGEHSFAFVGANCRGRTGKCSVHAY